LYDKKVSALFKETNLALETKEGQLHSGRIRRNYFIDRHDAFWDIFAKKQYRRKAWR